MYSGTSYPAGSRYTQLMSTSPVAVAAAVIKLTSDRRWRASAEEKRRHGGSTVTQFFADILVTEDGKKVRKPVRDAQGKMIMGVVGYGPTPGERGTYAKNVVIARFASGEWCI